MRPAGLGPVLALVAPLLGFCRFDPALPECHACRLPA